MTREDDYPEYLERDPGVPTWLAVSYIWIPLLGFLMFYLYWNGSQGWLDRGYWQQLERAANTTYPYINHNEPGGSE